VGTRCRYADDLLGYSHVNNFVGDGLRYSLLERMVVIELIDVVLIGIIVFMMLAIIFYTFVITAIINDILKQLKKKGW
jgi:hypothetical protein